MVLPCVAKTDADNKFRCWSGAGKAFDFGIKSIVLGSGGSATSVGRVGILPVDVDNPYCSVILLCGATGIGTDAVYSILPADMDLA